REVQRVPERQAERQCAPDGRQARSGLGRRIRHEPAGDDRDAPASRMRAAALLLLLSTCTGAAADDGGTLFNTCRACHSLDPAAKVMAGPNLAGLLGRKVAGDKKFDYSPALRQAADEGRMWSAEALERFLTDPEAMFPGTWMSRVPMGAPERQSLVRFI